MKKNMLIIILALPTALLMNHLTIENNAMKAASAYSFEEYGPTGRLSDDDITQKVKMVLAEDSSLNSHDITINTKRGIVDLQGKTNSLSDKERAVSLALNSRGVQAVKDEIKTASSATQP